MGWMSQRPFAVLARWLTSSSAIPVPQISIQPFEVAHAAAGIEERCRVPILSEAVFEGAAPASVPAQLDRKRGVFARIRGHQVLQA